MLWLMNNVLLNPGACKNITYEFRMCSLFYSIWVSIYSYKSFSFSLLIYEPILEMFFDRSAFIYLPPYLPLQTYFDSVQFTIIFSFSYTWSTNFPPWHNINDQVIFFNLNILNGSNDVVYWCFYIFSRILFCLLIRDAGSVKSTYSAARSALSARKSNFVELSYSDSSSINIPYINPLFI